MNFHVFNEQLLCLVPPSLAEGYYSFDWLILNLPSETFLYLTIPPDTSQLELPTSFPQT